VIVHLLEYQIMPGHAAEVEGFVRQALATSLPAGLLARCAGRRLSVDGPRYIVTSIWRDADAFRVGTNSSGIPRDLAGKAPLIRRRLSSQFRSVASHGTDWSDARVVRLYRAPIAQDSLGSWENSVQGEVRDIGGKPGISVVLAGVAIHAERVAADVPILVLTAWRDWDSLLGATGGRLNRAILGTELVGPQPLSLADHYELIGAEAEGEGPAQADSSGYSGRTDTE
jgi:hypothetical protein